MTDFHQTTPTMHFVTRDESIKDWSQKRQGHGVIYRWGGIQFAIQSELLVYNK